MQELSLSDCVKLPLPVLTLATRASTTPPPRQPAIPVLERVVVTPQPAPTAKGEGEVRAAAGAEVGETVGAAVEEPARSRWPPGPEGMAAGAEVREPFCRSSREVNTTIQDKACQSRKCGRF